MSEHSLPKNYKGYLTAELLALWKSIPDRTLKDDPVPGEKIEAMNFLFYEYNLLDFGPDGEDPVKIRRSKEMLAPYGIDPAPWTDENGIRQKELEDAWVKQLKREREARRQRNKALWKEE